MVTGVSSVIRRFYEDGTTATWFEPGCGRRMVRFHGIFVAQPHVREGQIIQEALDRIRVKVVPTNGFAAPDSHDIVRRVQQRLGSQVEVIVEPVDHIPRTAAGKFQAVVSKLQAAART